MWDHLIFIMGIPIPIRRHLYMDPRHVFYSIPYHHLKQCSLSLLRLYINKMSHAKQCSWCYFLQRCCHLTLRIEALIHHLCLDIVVLSLNTITRRSQHKHIYRKYQAYITFTLISLVWPYTKLEMWVLSVCINQVHQTKMHSRSLDLRDTRVPSMMYYILTQWPLGDAIII